jgi:hypothetical protein
MDYGIVGSDGYDLPAAAEWRLASQEIDEGTCNTVPTMEESPTAVFVGDVVQQEGCLANQETSGMQLNTAKENTNIQTPSPDGDIPSVALDKASQSRCGFAFVDDTGSSSENHSVVFTDDDDEESQFTANTIVSNTSDKPDATQVRTHAYDLLKRISEDSQKEASISSQVKSMHTEASSTGHREEHGAVNGQELSWTRRQKILKIVACLVVVLVLSLVISIVLFLSTDGNNRKASSPDKGDFPNDNVDLDITIVSTQAPTNRLELPQETVSKACQTIEGRPGVQLWQAEDAVAFLGNATSASKLTGYCGDGYATGVVSDGSRYVLGYIDVAKSGRYFLSMRYSNANVLQDREIIVSFDSIPMAFFSISPTDDASTWAIETVENILLKEGSHYVEVWTRHDVVDGKNNGPNIDWLALQLSRPMPRSQYILDTIQNKLGDSPSVLLQQLSWAQNASLAWMENEDSIMWSTLSSQELIERFVLAQFYYATSGKYWTINDGWLSTRHSCDWFGIICTTTGTGIRPNKLVTDLVLDDNALFGMLPPDIVLLEEMIALNLNHNNMEGEIFASPSIALPPKLSRLSLDSNYLSGTIPFDALLSSTHPTHLKALSLGNNRFIGSLSSDLYSMTSLETLMLANNSLTGTLSNEIGSKLKSLSTLNLQNNQLTGTIPASLGSLELDALNLNGNRFTGTVPLSLSKWNIRT